MNFRLTARAEADLDEIDDYVTILCPYSCLRSL